MTAARLVEVTLVMAWSPGVSERFEENRVVMHVALDAQGAPDVEAWLADPDRWPAKRQAPGEAPMAGDVAHDDDGWSLRFFPDGTPTADAPLHRIFVSGALRPGEVLTIEAPDGAEASWRVVGVG